MACLCKNKLAALTDPSFVTSLQASLDASLSLPPLPPLPSLPKLDESLSLGQPGSFDSSLAATIQGMQIPAIQLALSLPQLGALTAAAVTCKAQLGLPLPDSAMKLSLMLQSLDVSAFNPLMSLNLQALLNLSASASMALKLKAAFGAFPWDADLSGSFSAAVNAAFSGGMNLQANIPMPQLPNLLLSKIQQINQLNGLMSIATSLGVNLASPSGLADFAVALRPLGGISLPQINVSPELLARLSALENINSAFGLGASAPALPQLSLRLGSLRALLSLAPPLPKINLALGPQLPTPQQLDNVLSLNLPQLAAVNWNVSASLSLVTALPAISLAARLQAIMPSLSLNPCGASCPMQALAA
jgi:hypothetical protein